MIAPELAYEILDTAWQKYGGLGELCHGVNFFDLDTLDEPGKLVAAKVDELAVATQDLVLATQYVDVPDDVFSEDGEVLEVVSANSASIHPIIDARPSKLDGINNAEGVFVSSLSYWIGGVAVRENLIAWREGGTHRNRCEAGFWVSRGGPQPIIVRMYPEVLPRHTAKLEELL